MCMCVYIYLCVCVCIHIFLVNHSISEGNCLGENSSKHHYIMKLSAV